jgi:hypothetical protein
MLISSLQPQGCILYCSRAPGLLISTPCVQVGPNHLKAGLHLGAYQQSPPDCSLKLGTHALFRSAASGLHPIALHGLRMAPP